MKCENCPFFVVEGVENDMSWCKLYSAEAPVDGCEAERDAFIKQQEMMQSYSDKSQE
ncbi:MAG: hypothetical protein JSW28_09625 [Thermoplasmata archaeon]|nr:MAG: hypothetical protein JSW28_09625 [Thermoplasmata archaeon]